MKTAINLLRGQLLLLGQLKTLADRQLEALKKNRGDEAGRLALEQEKVIRELAAIEKNQASFLEAEKAADWKAYLDKTITSPEKKVALDMLEKIAVHLKDLRKAGKKSRFLLDRDVEYLNFSINVITGVSAGTTYAATANEPGSGKTVDMFDASV